MGSYKSHGQASKNAPVWPANQPFYDVQGQAPWLLDATNPVFAGFQQLQRERPDLFEALHSKPTEDEPPRPGARKILQWEMNVVRPLKELCSLSVFQQRSLTS